MKQLQTLRMKNQAIIHLAFMLIYCMITANKVMGANVEIIAGNQDDDGIQNIAIENLGGANPEIPDIEIGSGESNYFHGFSQEEIERNRIVKQYRNGTETVSSDEDVIKTLEYVRKSKNVNFLHDEPHFTREMKRGVIGRDDRTSRDQNSAPYSAMGYLEAGGYRCSAYLVGPRQLITAAHCLHPRGSPGSIFSPSQITFYLKKTCYSTGTAYSIDEVLTYIEYRNSGSKDHDIACLLLSSSAPDWMGYAYHDPMPTVSGEVCGYPGDRGQCFVCAHCSDIRRLKTGWWIFSSTNNRRLQYTCDNVGGMSGGPVITNDHDGSQYYSYGVNTRESSSLNYGVRITRNYFYDICQWKCDTGARCSARC